VRTEKPSAVAAFRAKTQTHTAREIDRRRAAVAVFSNLGLKARLGFGVRGLRRVRREALGACLTYHIQPWIRRRGRTLQVQGP
jgi:hypothetical protein